NDETCLHYRFSAKDMAVKKKNNQTNVEYFARLIGVLAARISCLIMHVTICKDVADLHSSESIIAHAKSESRHRVASIDVLDGENKERLRGSICWLFPSEPVWGSKFDWSGHLSQDEASLPSLLNRLTTIQEAPRGGQLSKGLKRRVRLVVHLLAQEDD
ncbi:hypothetical protein CLAIMM_00207, partial [Cladophialophora immunda]